MNDRTMTRASRHSRRAVRLLAVLGMAATMVVSTGGGAQATDGAQRSSGCQLIHDGALTFTDERHVGVTGEFARGETIDVEVIDAAGGTIAYTVGEFLPNGSIVAVHFASLLTGETDRYTFDRTFVSATGDEPVHVGLSRTPPNIGFSVEADCSPAPDLDSDGDGVIDDACTGTPSGSVVDATGCSVDQLVPCDGSWRNHGKYVSALAKVVDRFEHDGLLSPDEADAATSRAAESDCAR